MSPNDLFQRKLPFHSLQYDRLTWKREKGYPTPKVKSLWPSVWTSFNNIRGDIGRVEEMISYSLCNVSVEILFYTKVTVLELQYLYGISCYVLLSWKVDGLIGSKDTRELFLRTSCNRDMETCFTGRITILSYSFTSSFHLVFKSDQDSFCSCSISKGIEKYY